MEARSRRQILFALSVLVLLLTVAAQARFALVDVRLPPDANHAHQTLPLIHHCLGSSHDWPLALRAAAAETAGWYNFLIAGIMHLTGSGAGVLRAFHLVWVTGVLLGIWMLGRRLWGEAAGLLALLLISPLSMGIHQLGRMGWIHVAELALLLQVMDGLVAAPRLERRAAVARVAICGLLVLALRPTGLVWVATVAPLLVLARRRGAPLKRVLVVAGTWSLALLPVIRDIGPYMEDKLEARAHYQSIAGLALMVPQLVDDLGLPWAVASLIGILLLLFGGALRPILPRVVLASWLVVPLVLYMAFNVGLVNFPVLYAAAALLGAAGLSRVPVPLVAAPLLLLWLGAYTAQWLPMPLAESIYRRIDGAHIGLHRDSPNNYFRPYSAPALTEILTLLDRACPPGKGRCPVVAESSLLHPAGLDSGRLGLFLLGRGDVDLLEMRDLGSPGEVPMPGAYARFDCPEYAADFTRRQPDVHSRGADLLAAKGLRLARRLELEPGCSYLWYTPNQRPWR